MLLLNKTAFQSKSDHPRMCVLNYTRLTFLFLWPWPLHDDLDIRAWPRYSEDVSAYHNKVSNSRLL